jgi:mono/diheme cytochrome c family protein
MRARVIATSQQAYDTYISSAVKTDLGRSEFVGVCAVCHGMQAQGGYGPAIAANSIITQAAGLDQIVTEGRGRMPAVSAGWTKEQLHALLAYLKQSVYKGATASGG